MQVNAAVDAGTGMDTRVDAGPGVGYGQDTVCKVDAIIERTAI